MQDGALQSGCAPDVAVAANNGAVEACASIHRAPTANKGAF